MRIGGMARPAGGPAAAAVALAVAAALALAGCGGGGETTGAQAPPSAPTTAQTTARETAPPPPATACRHQLGEFLGGLATLRTNLVAGLDYEGYVGEVRRIRRGYEAIPVDALSLSCLHAAGTPGERALNRYIAAGNTWTDCVEASGCEAVSIEADLQAKWRQASRYLSKAQHGLAGQSAG
ncbi:MAG: hypothetical protein U0R71_05510 [Solirubrobacterales bacterium]